MYKLSKQIGQKYRIQTGKGGFLRQMGPRKLSKNRAEYRIAVLNGEEPYDYPDDPTSPEVQESVDAAINAYVEKQQGYIATAQGKIDAANAIIEEQNAIIVEQQAILDNPESTEEEKIAAQEAILAARAKINTNERTIATQEKNIATYQNNIANAATKVTSIDINEVPELLTLNDPGYKVNIEADFTVNDPTVIESNEKVTKGITIKNTGEEPANILINVGNSDVTLATNSKWGTVVIESVGNNSLTVATNTHIEKLILKRGHVKVNNAFVEDCIDEVEIEGGVIEANKEVDITKASQLSTSTPAVYRIGTDVSARNFALGTFASGHFVFENNAVASTTGTGTSSGFILRGSGKMTVEFTGEGEWRSATNPTIWSALADAHVKIYSGKYFNDGNHSECIYAELGTIEIFGGEFHNVDDGSKNFLLNCKDANYTSGKANIIVYGGKFYGFDPAHNETEGENTNFVAEGYESVYHEDGNYYEVVPVDAGE